jgi:hypothetical protein
VVSNLGRALRRENDYWCPRHMNKLMDTLILSLTTDRWQKVARIIALVLDRAPDGTDFEMMAGRIRVLVEEGKLQAKGDLTRWTHSEIRRAG